MVPRNERSAKHDRVCQCAVVVGRERFEFTVDINTELDTEVPDWKSTAPVSRGVA